MVCLSLILYTQAIFFTRFLCRPPSNSVCIKISTIFSTSPSLTKRAGMQIILASLCFLASAANSSPQHIAALMPWCLLAVIATPLPVPHGRAEVNGYMLSRSGRNLIAYLSDCSGVPDVITQNIFGVECLIIDALREKPHPTHLSVAQALEVAARVQPKETYFTHIAHELSQSFEKTLPPHTHIAYDGLKLSFG